MLFRSELLAKEGVLRGRTGGAEVVGGFGVERVDGGGHGGVLILEFFFFFFLFILHGSLRLKA